MTSLSINKQGFVTTMDEREQGVVPGATWLLDYCIQQGWEAHIMGQHEMPSEKTVTSSGYTLVRLLEDQSPLPAYVKARIDSLVDLGYRKDRMLIIHEPDPGPVGHSRPKSLPERFGITPQNAEMA